LKPIPSPLAWMSSPQSKFFIRLYQNGNRLGSALVVSIALPKDAFPVYEMGFLLRIK